MRRTVKVAIGVVLVAVAGLAIYEAAAIARARARTPAVIARAREGELPLSALSRQRREALLAVDDPGFFRHRGVDFETPGQGRTTITQGLVKRFYFERFTPGFAKIEQSLIARYVLDPALSKPEQIAAYLNHSYFGHMRGRAIIGFADAARTYHSRDFRTLTDAQFLSLVAMTIGPNALDPVRHPAANAERVRRIEALLAKRCRPDGVWDVTYESCA